MTTIAELKQQIKELTDALDMRKACWESLDLANKQLADLKAENERLREALEAVAEWRFDLDGDCVAEATYLARAALGGKPPTARARGENDG